MEMKPGQILAQAGLRSYMNILRFPFLLQCFPDALSHSLLTLILEPSLHFSVL